MSALYEKKKHWSCSEVAKSFRMETLIESYMSSPQALLVLTVCRLIISLTWSLLLMATKLCRTDQSRLGQRHNWNRSKTQLEVLALADSSIMEALGNIGDCWQTDRTIIRQQCSPPRWNWPCCGEGADPTKKFQQSASTKRAQLSVAATSVRFNQSSQL